MNEVPESVTFAAPPPPPAPLDEDGIRLLMELRGCISMAMAVGGAKTSQMDLYQFIWYAMEAGRVRLYPTLSWVAEAGVDTDLGGSVKLRNISLVFLRRKSETN